MVNWHYLDKVSLVARSEYDVVPFRIESVRDDFHLFHGLRKVGEFASQDGAFDAVDKFEAAEKASLEASREKVEEKKFGFSLSK